MNIRKSINKALAEAEKSKLWLSEVTGLDRKHIYTMGVKSNPNLATVQKLASAFDMSVSEFIALGED
jgi:DNA-binding phage protein